MPESVATRSGDVFRRWAVFVVAAILAQAAYWFVLSPELGQRTHLPADTLISEYQFAPLAEPTLEAARAVSDADWSLIQSGWERPSGEGPVALRFTFSLNIAPAEDLGLIVGIGADNAHVWLNGYPVATEGRLAPEPTFQWRRTRGVLKASAAAARSGENEVLIIAVRDAPGYLSVFRSAVGDYKAVTDATARRAFMVGPYALGVMILFGLIGLFAFLVTPFARNRAFTAWLGVLAVGLAYGELERRILDPPWPGEVVAALYFAQAFVVAAAWFNLLDAWTGRGWPLARRTVTGLALGLAGVGAAFVMTRGAAGYDLAAALADGWKLIAGLAAVALFAWRLRGEGPERPFETAALLVGVVALIIDAWEQLSSGRRTNHMLYSMPYLLFGFAAAVLVRNVRIYESQAALTADLQARLDVREAELADQYERERAFVRRQAHDEERRRIMRDMHDGLGSQLMSMLLAARRGAIKSDRIAEGLQNVIDEMRLMIDSMDSVGESLDAALSTFRERTQVRVTQAGFAFDWTKASSGGHLSYGPRDVLQVFRILQEAVTNAIRHSGGDRIAIAIVDAGDGRTKISITDNGTGFDDPAGPGRGLANIRARAGAIGANVAWRRGDPGTIFELWLARDALGRDA